MLSFKKLGERVANLFRKPPKDRIVFFHIPKCGGVSLTDTLRSRYLSLDSRSYREVISLDVSASDNAIKIQKELNNQSHIVAEDQVLEFREHLLLYFLSRAQTRFLSGHFQFSEVAYRNFSKKFAFVTVLRDPVERWISAYFYNRYKQSNHRKVILDIDDYLNSELGVQQGREYIKFIGGIYETGMCVTPEAIERAKRNLHKFDIVGILEDQEKLIERFEARFGIRLRLGMKNTNPKSQQDRNLIMTETRRRKVQEICAPDLEVYQYAVKNFLEERRTAL